MIGGSVRARAMPVVDASVVIDWRAPGVATTAPAVKLLDRLARRSAEIVGPRLLFEEVSNALITGSPATLEWCGCRRLPQSASAPPNSITDDRRDLDRAWELARRHDNHPIYGMIYVALAERTRTGLITAAEALRRRLAHLTWVVGPAQAMVDATPSHH
jgi:predicted nucleic acid-binding protein